MRIFCFSAILFYLLASPGISPYFVVPQNRVISTHSISLENRHPDAWVNNVFKDNILLNIAYLDGRVKKVSDINWGNLRKAFIYELVLSPNETFAFHEDIQAQYKDTQIKTTNAHFNLQDGFRHSGYLAGDGVCHLASLIYWVAKDANIDASAPVNHDFRAIPEIPKEYGVSIYNYPGHTYANSLQNLYVANNAESDITFIFDFDGENLKISVKGEAGKRIYNI